MNRLEKLVLKGLIAWHRLKRDSVPHEERRREREWARTGRYKLERLKKMKREDRFELGINWSCEPETSDLLYNLYPGKVVMIYGDCVAGYGADLGEASLSTKSHGINLEDCWPQYKEGCAGVCSMAA